jgi:flagellar biosynthesis/type III secretory pathway protein FliH
MSSRARRLAESSSAAAATVMPVASWLEAVVEGAVPASGRRAAQRVSAVTGGQAVPALSHAPAPVPTPQEDLFAKGFAEGQRAAAAAAQQETAALAKKLAATLDDLMRVRNDMIRHTEKQMVQLALAVARRVVHREVSIDTNVLVTMMRVALERVSDAARVTVRLNPADHQAVAAALSDGATSGQVTLTADGRVPRGGCKVESDYGDIEAGVDAQIQEIARALLGGDGGARA